jgi:hypothetical protein
MDRNRFPKARPGCFARELDDEIVVYDPQRHIGHCLNSTAARVWRLCDGRKSASDIAALLSRQLGVLVDQRIVQAAVRQLRGVHLLVGCEVPVRPPSRRAAIRKIGAASAIALPLITSLVAPTPANAITCLAALQHCTSNAQCCSHLCVGLLCT